MGLCAGMSPPSTLLRHWANSKPINGCAVLEWHYCGMSPSQKPQGRNGKINPSHKLALLSHACVRPRHCWRHVRARPCHFWSPERQQCQPQFSQGDPLPRWLLVGSLPTYPAGTVSLPAASGLDLQGSVSSACCSTWKLPCIVGSAQQLSMSPLTRVPGIILGYG